jgi:hypothetical protein
LVGGNLDTTKNKVNDVKNASTDLKNELKDKVIPAVSDTLSEVRSLTSAYAAQRTNVLALRSAYELLAQSIKKAIAAQAQEQKKEETTTEPPKVEEKPK